MDNIEKQLNDLTARVERLEGTSKDYSHLLPDGYEFCNEEQAEKWVKVEMNPEDKAISQTPIGYWGDEPGNEDYIPFYRPICKKQPNDPYQPDWSQAPEGTVAHAYDGDGLGYWYMISINWLIWFEGSIKSSYTLPANLDWKQSLRINPNLK